MEVHVLWHPRNISQQLNLSLRITLNWKELPHPRSSPCLGDWATFSNCSNNHLISLQNSALLCQFRIGLQDHTNVWVPCRTCQGLCYDSIIIQHLLLTNPFVHICSKVFIQWWNFIDTSCIQIFVSKPVLLKTWHKTDGDDWLSILIIDINISAY